MSASSAATSGTATPAAAPAGTRSMLERADANVQKWLSCSRISKPVARSHISTVPACADGHRCASSRPAAAAIASATSSARIRPSTARRANVSDMRSARPGTCRSGGAAATAAAAAAVAFSGAPKGAWPATASSALASSGSTRQSSTRCRAAWSTHRSPPPSAPSPPLFRARAHTERTADTNAARSTGAEAPDVQRWSPSATLLAVLSLRSGTLASPAAADSSGSSSACSSSPSSAAAGAGEPRCLCRRRRRRREPRPPRAASAVLAAEGVAEVAAAAAAAAAAAGAGAAVRSSSSCSSTSQHCPVVLSRLCRNARAANEPRSTCDTSHAGAQTRQQKAASSTSLNARADNATLAGRSAPESPETASEARPRARSVAAAAATSIRCPESASRTCRRAV